MLPELAAATWVGLVLAAFVVGIGKSAIPAVGALAVVLGAAVLPARESTGVLLVMFLLGDVFAVATYHRNAQWRLLARLAPALLAGILGGAVFLAWADDRITAITIGVILISLIALTLVNRRRGSSPRPHTGTYGILGGFTMMVANAGGPPMSLYFLAQRLQILAFLGTSAWLFALTNLVRLPFSIGLGLVTGKTLALTLALLPVIAAGFFAGRVFVRRIDQRMFDRIVILATIAGAAYLILDAA